MDIDAKRADYTTTLGDRLTQKRKEQGWTQARLGAKAGTNQAYIQKVENGKSLRPRKLDAIADALGVSPVWLMFGIEQFDDEVVEWALAWSKLQEPHRSVLKDMILKLTV